MPSALRSTSPIFETDVLRVSLDTIAGSTDAFANRRAATSLSSVDSSQSGSARYDGVSV